LEAYEQALALFVALKDHPSQASALQNIGGVLVALGETSRARESYERALALRRALGDLRGEATTRQALASVCEGAGAG
jgi:predicted negative regulator of RcsB-dependent stress response